MNQFTSLNYLLVFFALAAHYPLGKRLGVKPFFTACIAGVSFSALIVASLANVYAGLIRYYILFSLFAGAGVWLYDFFKQRSEKQVFKNIKIYFLLAIVGVVFFLFNNPYKTYLGYSGDGHVSMDYNNHYSYYSSQSVAMLNARYLSRLKIANAYPYEWTTYHFFNSASQAIAQGFMRRPTLFTYLIAQLFITLFVLLSFIEVLFLWHGAKVKNIIIVLTWFVIGFTVFFDSIGWNAIGSGILSVYAVIHILFSLVSRQYKNSALFTFILGASAFRMMPVALSLLTIFAVYALVHNRHLWKDIHTIRIYLKRIRPLDYAGIIAFALYNYVTIFSVKSNLHLYRSLFTADVFSVGWMYILSSFKIIGYLAERIGRESIFLHFNEYDFFGRILYYKLLGVLFINLLVLCILHIVLQIRKILGKINKRYYYFIAAGLLNAVFIHYYLPPQFFLLHLIVIPYALVMFVFGSRICSLCDDTFQKRLLSGFIIIAFFSTLVLQYIGYDAHVKIPPMYIMYDILVWGMTAIYLHATVTSKKLLLVPISLMVSLLLLFNFYMKDLLKIQTYDEIDISSIMAKDFQRADYVDDTNMMKNIPSDSKYADAYSAILGANLPYSESYTTVMSYGFRQPLRQ